MQSNNPLKPLPSRPLFDFRGTKQYIYAVEQVKVLPPDIDDDVPALYVMTRWMPTVEYGPQTARWRERNFGWCKTTDPRVIYGLERWGGWDDGTPDLQIKGKYSEWFSLCVIHPRLTTGGTALKLCEDAVVGI